MKSIINFILILSVFISCSNPSTKKEDKQDNSENDSIQIVRNPFKNEPSKIEFEIPILKGTKLRHGVQKRFYTNGDLYSQIPFTRNVRNGIAYTYYQSFGNGEPMVWKEQPYINGKLDGVCKRYYEDGKLQAEYTYKNGLPALGLKEYSQSGKEINQPKLILSKKNVDGYIQINAKMSNNSKKVKMFTGVLVDGKYISDNKKEITVKNGMGEILIPASSNVKSVTVIATLFTKYYNTYYTAQTIYL